jgi:hypothetical protein
MFEQGGRCSIWGPPTQQARFFEEENRDCVVSNMEEVVRPLSSEEDVDAWAAFCASCFADKRPTPPSQAFFRAHYDLDPQRGAGARSSMLVAAAGAEAGADILSSVCVYRRELCVGGAVVVVGGVGDVCTAVAARGRGLCKRAVLAALGVMARQDTRLSALHAGPHVAPMYAALGWRSASLKWRPVALLRPPPAAQGAGGGGARAVREASPADAADAAALAALHRPYALRFNGPVARDAQYWSRWVVGQLGADRYWVLADAAAADDDADDADDADAPASPSSPSRLRALLCIQTYRGALKVRDFASCPEDVAADGGAAAFAQLARHALAVPPLASGAVAEPTCIPTVLVPAPIAAEFAAGGGEAVAGMRVAPAGAEGETEDLGWMYRAIAPAAEEGAAAAAASEGGALLSRLLAGKQAGRPHLVFPIDHF